MIYFIICSAVNSGECGPKPIILLSFFLFWCKSQLYHATSALWVKFDFWLVKIKQLVSVI